MNTPTSVAFCSDGIEAPVRARKEKRSESAFYLTFPLRQAIVTMHRTIAMAVIDLL
jgi:hypothetical protein